jgi:hypothetical protein
MVSGERTDSASDVTQREFLGGQKLFGRYTLIRILGRGGMGMGTLKSRTQSATQNIAARSHLSVIRVYDEAGNAIETRQGSLSKDRICRKISEDRCWFGRWARLMETTAAPGCHLHFVGVWHERCYGCRDSFLAHVGSW